MSLKKLFRVLLGIQVVLGMGLAILTFYLFRNQNELSESQRVHFETYLLADELRQSSDDLTRLARTYVATGNEEFERQYWAVLDIRNGKLPRPSNYDRIYWDFVSGTGRKPRPDDTIISLHDLMVREGFTSAELDKLTLSQKYSDELVKTEKISMNAVKGLFDDGSGNFTVKKNPDRELAIKLMNDEAYHRNKVNIMKPIDEFYLMFAERTDADVAKYEQRSMVLLQSLGELIFIILGMFGFSFVMIKRQIDERLHTEELLKDSESRYRGLFEHANEGLLIMTEEGKLSEFNHMFAEMHGYKTDELRDKYIGYLDVLKEKTLEESANIVNRMKKGEVVRFEVEHYHKDGHIVPLSVTTNIINIDGKKYYLAFHQDITERKKIDEIIRESEERFRSVTEFANDAIITCNIKGRISLWNAGAEKMFGYTEAEIKGKLLNVIIPQEYLEQHIEGIKRAESGGKNHVIGKTIELQGLHKSGNVFPIELSLSEWKTSKEKFYTGIIRDITERKLAEEEIIKAKERAEESDRLKSSFLANMSHEIRTPMNGILGFTELLKEPNLSGEEQQKYISVIERSGARMLNTINDIINISKVESGQMEISLSDTNINDKIEHLYKFFGPIGEKKGIKVFFKNGLPETESIIKTDREKLNGIITNLINNAIKFTSEGSVEFGYEKKNNFLEFFVKDTGAGISQEHIEIIFKRFRQGSEGLSRGYEGSGLGLTISKAYVEMLGGKIWVESEEGKGSTFYFTVPYNVDSFQLSLDSSKVIPLRENESPNSDKLKILIAEDDETSGLFISKIVKEYSKEILRTVTGTETVEVCRNNPDIDLILMDIKMPELGGNEATKQIRQFNRDVIIIAQTAYALTGDREKFIDAGCNDYISKPLNRELLKEIIDKYFRE